MCYSNFRNCKAWRELRLWRHDGTKALFTAGDRYRETISMGGALPVAAFFLGTCGVDVASATTITYTGYSVPYSDGFNITAPNNIAGLAGQIQLTGVSGAGLPSTVLAWCVDIDHFLQNTGTYTVELPQSPPLPMITGSQELKMGGLMVEGNALLAGSALTFNGHTYTKNDISAATQVAIWTVEYGSLTYSISGSSLNSNDFGGLVSYLTTSAGNTDWQLLDGSAYPSGKKGSYTYDQNLGTIPAGGAATFRFPVPLWVVDLHPWCWRAWGCCYYCGVVARRGQRQPADRAHRDPAR